MSWSCLGLVNMLVSVGVALITKLNQTEEVHHLLSLVGDPESLCVFAHHALNCHYLTEPQTNRDKFIVKLH